MLPAGRNLSSHPSGIYLHVSDRLVPGRNDEVRRGWLQGSHSWVISFCSWGRWKPLGGNNPNTKMWDNMRVVDLIFIVIARIPGCYQPVQTQNCAHFPTSALGASLPSHTSPHHLSSLPCTSHDHSVIKLVNLHFPHFYFLCATPFSPPGAPFCIRFSRVLSSLAPHQLSFRLGLFTSMLMASGPLG